MQNRGSLFPARDPSRFINKSLLLVATEEFVANDRPTLIEISKYKELFYPLCMKSAPEERQKISLLLSRYPYAPRSVILFFALDTIQVATPCLLYSPILNDRDLIGLTHRNLPEHAYVIAQRSDLNQTVVNALLSSDDNERNILRILRENTYLTNSPKIQTTLRRASLTSQTSDSELPQREVSDMTSLGLSDSSKSQDLSEALLNLASKGGRLGSQKPRAATLHHREIKNENAAQLLRSARALNHEAFAHTIQRICKIDMNVTMDAIASQDTGFLAVLLRANEVSRIVASRILLILTPDLGRDIAVLKRVLDKYDLMTIEQCMDYLGQHGANFAIGELHFSRDASREQTPAHADRHKSPMRDEVRTTPHSPQLKSTG